MTAGATASATTSEGRTALLTVIAAVVILLTREPATLLAPQLWAEVGTIFASDVLMGRDVGLFAPYAGYFQLVPRAISAVIVPITPLELLPLALNVAAVLVSGLVVYLVALPAFRSPTVGSTRWPWSSCPTAARSGPQPPTSTGLAASCC